MRVFLVMAFLGLLAGLFVWRFPYVTFSKEEKERLILTIPVLVMLVSGAMANYRGRGGEMLRHLMLWCIAVIVIITGYSYRDALMNNRIIGSLVPQRAIVANDGTVMFRKAQDGHFYMELSINNVLVKFMVDTGASDITLTAEDARRIGLQPESLAYTRTYHTANGIISGAPVILPEVSVGSISLKNIPASVNKADMGNSLLGMAFFHQLRGFSVEGDVLTLRP